MKKKIVLWLLILVALGMMSGVYKIEDGEEAVVMRFGRYERTESGGGLKYLIPIVENKYVINTSQVRRMEFGYKTLNENRSYDEQAYEDISGEAIMITGDENLVSVMASIQYRIVNTKDYIFNVEEPEDTLNIVAVSAIRRSVANNDLDDVLADNKYAIMQEIRNDLQKIADSYGLGIQITQVLLQDVDPPKEVDDAFKDIVRAQLDKESRINEAMSFENRLIPEAKGEAARMKSEAEAYKETRIQEALGDAAAFNKIYNEYKNNKEVTRSRMYLETMEQVLGKVEIIIAGENGSTLKLLPLDSFNGTSDTLTNGEAK